MARLPKNIKLWMTNFVQYIMAYVIIFNQSQNAQLQPGDKNSEEREFTQLDIPPELYL